MKTNFEVRKLEFTTLKFHKDYVTSQIEEGAIIGKSEIQKLIDVCTQYYEEEPFVYLSNRTSNYNVDPTIYLDLLKVKNLAGIAVVSDRLPSLKMATFEKNFAKVPFEIFLEMEDAVEWAENAIKNKKADL